MNLPQHESVQPDLVERLKRHEARNGGLAHPGAMMDAPLRVLEYYLSRYYGSARPMRTAQTGCGSSTVVFGAYSAAHRVYCVDDSGEPRSTLQLVRSLPEFDPSNVEFVLGPPSETLFTQPPDGPFDLILIDGPHAHPGPELAYHALAPHLVAGGILALDDITIPTIAHLFSVLCADDLFVLHDVVNTTAFFWRSSAPMKRPEESGWWLQRYNVQHFPALHLDRYGVPLELPVRISFDGYHNSLDDYFVRGFALADHHPVTEGSFSRMRLPVANGVGPLRITCEVAVAQGCHEEQVTFTLSSGAAQTGPHTIEKGHVEAVQLDVGEVAGGHILLDVLRLDAAGPRAGDTDFSVPGLQFHAIDLRTSVEPIPVPDVVSGPDTLPVPIANRASPSFQRHDGTIVTLDHLGTRLRFFVDDPGEAIQAHHVRGALYEREELALLSALVPKGIRVIDIGANVGNHTIYFAKVLAASSVIVFEPQAHVGELLRMNCLLNAADTVDLSHLGIALGRANGNGEMRIPQQFNRGGAMLHPNPSGPVPVRRGDELLHDAQADLVKIDVEGSEVDVLQGLVELIERCSPLLWVEVWNRHRGPFNRLMDDLGYGVVGEFRRYDVATNLFLRRRPVPAVAAR